MYGAGIVSHTLGCDQQEGQLCTDSIQPSDCLFTVFRFDVIAELQKRFQLLWLQGQMYGKIVVGELYITNLL